MPHGGKNGDQGLSRNPSRSMCPFLSDPFEECLCRDMGSLKTLAVIRLCGKDFKACEIYRTRGGKWETESDRSG